MSSILQDATVIWAIVLMVVLPAAVIGAGEVEERLRQRDSSFRPVLSMLRWVTIPFLAVWTVLTVLAGLRADNPAVRLVVTGVLLSAMLASISASRLVLTRVRDRRGADGRGQVPQLLLALPRVAVVLVVGWVLLDRVWGVDLSAALTALGVTSLVVSFALQDTLSGLASGLLLLSDAPFSTGDWIRHGELEGRVVDVNWRSTRIENRDGDLVVVPNAELAAAMLVNFDRPTRVHRVVVPVQVAYVNPPTRARAMLLDAARSTPGVLDDPEPRARIVQVDDPLMGYEVDLWVDDFRIAPRVSSEFGALVWYHSHRHDVPLPSPAYDLYVHDGVAAATAGEPDEAEIRRRLRVSPLLVELDDAELDQLATGARAARFAAHETMLALSASEADLYVRWAGRARLVAGDEGDPLDAGELRAGDIFGRLGHPMRTEGAPRVTAVTDCEVVIVAGSAAAQVISRNTALSEAVQQIVSSRQRRIERVVERAAQRRAAANGQKRDSAAAPEARAVD